MTEQTELTTEQKKKEQKIMGLAETNSKMIAAVQQVGGNVELGVPRLENFVAFLIDQGVINMDQALDERIQWELRLRTELQPIYERIKTVHRMNGGQMQTDSGLIVPGKGHSGG